MARAIWSGTISFGLVSVPVKAYTAVRDHTVHFHQLEKKSGARIRNKKVSEKTGREVEPGDIAMGYELAKGKHVTLEKGEIEELRPESTRAIEIEDFVELADIDPVYYERTYWLAPDGDSAARPYRLLVAAMEDAGRAGIGTVVMRNKQYLTAIRSLDGALAMSTMRFADEVVSRSDIDGLPTARTKVDAKERRLAAQIIEALASDWKPGKYHDTYTEQLEELIAKRAAGEDVTVEQPTPESEKVVDLMEALQKSLAATKSSRNKPARKAPAKKSA